MSRGKIRIGFTAAEAAHIYRDLRDLPKVERLHGNRNVSRETHDKIMERLAMFLEVAYGTPYGSKPVVPESGAEAPAGLDAE